METVKRPRKFATSLGAVVLVLVMALPALAEQLQPAADPVTSGPLVLRSTQCARERAEGTTEGTAAIAKACIRFYELDEAGESDPARPSVADPVVAEHVAWARARLTGTN